MKKRFLSTGILFMVLVALLAAIGIGYAHWTKTLNIDGTVNTGTVDAIFVAAFTDDDDAVDNPDKDSQDTDGCVDLGLVDDAGTYNQQKDGPDNGYTSCDPAASGRDEKEHYEKDVARCDAAIDADDNEQAYVELVNAYPSYYCTAWFEIQNNGTIPVKIQEVRVNGVVVEPSQTNGFDLDEDGNADVDIHVTDITIGQQIEPEDPDNPGANDAQMDLDIHVLQDSAQGANMTFEVEVDLVQWNLYED
jgi:hypothetical protein